MIVWTDYPFMPGDSLNAAPTRKVRVVAWDSNKYVLIRYRQHYEEVHYGYLFEERRLIGTDWFADFEKYPCWEDISKNDSRYDRWNEVRNRNNPPRRR